MGKSDIGDGNGSKKQEREVRPYTPRASVAGLVAHVFRQAGARLVCSRGLFCFYALVSPDRHGIEHGRALPTLPASWPESRMKEEPDPESLFELPAAHAHGYIAGRGALGEERDALKIRLLK